MPGLPEAAARDGLSPLDYMRRHGAFLVEDLVCEVRDQEIEGRFEFDEREAVMRGHGRIAGVPKGRRDASRLPDAEPEDRHGEVFVGPELSMRVFEERLAKAPFGSVPADSGASST
ncbi:MAG: hypothetical protein Fur0037_19860 [Planctomycetota bacterium]